AESNRWPLQCECNALPTELQAHGGAEGDRTPCLIDAIDALYQVSYGPMVEPGRIALPH
ncbi:MAG: hypothetical protein UY40_C0007G0033, partial [candidate division CPR1 bacterium GW2011_GWC1_49_13]